MLEQYFVSMAARRKVRNNDSVVTRHARRRQFV